MTVFEMLILDAHSVLITWKVGSGAIPNRTQFTWHKMPDARCHLPSAVGPLVNEAVSACKPSSLAPGPTNFIDPRRRREGPRTNHAHTAHCTAIIGIWVAPADGRRFHFPVCGGCVQSAVSSAGPRAKSSECQRPPLMVDVPEYLLCTLRLPWSRQWRQRHCGFVAEHPRTSILGLGVHQYCCVFGSGESVLRNRIDSTGFGPVTTGSRCSFMIQSAFVS